VNPADHWRSRTAIIRAMASATGATVCGQANPWVLSQPARSWMCRTFTFSTASAIASANSPAFAATRHASLPRIAAGNPPAANGLSTTQRPRESDSVSLSCDPPPVVAGASATAATAYVSVTYANVTPTITPTPTHSHTSHPLPPHHH